MKKPQRYEGSPADQRADRANAKKYDMSLAKYQRSDIDKRNDAKGQKALDARAKAKRK